MVSAAAYRTLREERDELAERLLQLEGSKRGEEYDDILPAFMRVYGLTKSEAHILWRMFTSSCPLRYEFFDEEWPSGKEPRINTLNVFICKMRAKLSAHGIEIRNCWGLGYVISDEAKSTLRHVVAT
jgi:DNA-binding response OmpR family regulator